jgi:hypothetical protein
MVETGWFTPDLFYGVAAFAEREPALGRAAWLVLYYHVHPAGPEGALRRALAELDAYLGMFTLRT